jgi:FtsP/CotA-like multicopper oxidase with cupredoxin domain
MKKVAFSVLTGLMAGGGLAVLVALLAPAGAAHAATVACTAPSDLYAVAGTTTLGAQSVTVWGYNTTGAAAAQPGGPTLCVNAGNTVTITLHNALSENTALLFQGQNVIPDRVGATAGGTHVYTFTAGAPGTYLYEAGLLPNAQHQVAMGLYGALIVRPATAGQAYNDPSTAYADEAVLVLSEVDPALNNRTVIQGGPATFDMRKYAPKYFLINGKAYPDTDPIAAGPGNKVLLRYVNAGIGYHSAAVLGAAQTVIALDGSPLNVSRRYVAETFGPGQTTDAILTAPAATTDANRLAIYDGSLLLHNSNLAGTGGMLTFVTIPGTGPGLDVTGPVTSAVAYSAGTLTATIDETTTGGSNVTAAEYYLDSVTTAPTAMGGTFGSATVAVTAPVPSPTGQHIIYVRGQDFAGNWGVFSSVLVTGGDVVGPATTSPALTPALTNGSLPVAVHATGNDTATGGSNITGAEYFIGAAAGTDGTGTAMTVNLAAPIASLDATIPQAVVTAVEGTRTVWIHAQDQFGNWGLPVSVNLLVDKTAPTTTGLSAAPTPNNGTLAFNAGTPAVRVTASTMSDLTGPINSTITGAEAFIDTVGVSGTGAVFSASDGAFNTTSEAGYTDIPLATVAQLTNGTHTIYVHAKDAAGNWGATTTTTLLIDKIAPAVTAVTAAPNPTLGATTVTLTATATDAGTAVTRAEWFTGADPGVGNGNPMTLTGTGPWSLSSAPIDVSSWNEGAYTLNVRALDAAGNWNVPATTLLQVRGPLYFSTVGSTNPPGVVGTADDADIYNWSGTAFSRSIDASATPYNLPGGANVDGFDRVSATQFYLSFTGQVNVPGIGNVQDEDVVFFNGTSWSLFFDGSVRGLTGTSATDLDAISIVGGQLFFSTDNGAIPPGAGGVGDDADIYRWNGASTYTRVIDASAAPYSLPAAANVDGFVRVDATHFYLSFSADTTVSVLGAVQDEDVIYYNNGIWSVYFDGTAHGLTAANLDVDAFDVP